MKIRFLFRKIPDKVWFFLIALLLVWGIGGWIWGNWLFEWEFYKGFNGVLSSREDYKDIAVEFHGMIFDVILFGVILTAYEYYSDKKQKKGLIAREKRLRIERYQEELDDYRGWRGEKAAFRVAGIVNRLLKEGIEDIDLSNLHAGQLVQTFGEKGKEWIETILKNKKSFCSLQRAKLIGANLQYVKLRDAKLEEAKLSEANLEGARLNGANLQGANLHNAYLESAFLIKTNLEGAKLWQAILISVDLRWGNLQEASFSGANLEGADLREAKLKGADFNGANLNEVIAFQYQKEAFSKVMAEWQLRSIKWKENPPGYKPPNKETETNSAPKEREILTGPKGGKYYINDEEKKVYIRKK